MACGPLAHAVEGLTGEEKVSEQDEESGGGIDAAAFIGAGEIVTEDVFESQAMEDAIEDGEESDAVGEELVSGGLSASADLGGGLGIVWVVHGCCSRRVPRKRAGALAALARRVGGGVWLAAIAVKMVAGRKQ
jgi:hypothetical protein